MKRKTSIISNSININQIYYAFKNSKKYEVDKICDEFVDLDGLKNSESIFVDSNIKKNILFKIERFCLDNNIELNIFPDSLYLRKAKINQVDDLCFLKINNYTLTTFQSFMKRIFDIVFSLIFIIIGFPLFIMIILFIKIIDGGPVFYLQKRITKDEKEFVIYKFRTMKVGAEKETGAVLSTQDDKRITRLGKLLRRLSLDELPQIFNVLRGDMSVVGPRPERRYFINKYKRINEYYKYRFNVKAGITGYAQIYAKYDSSYKDKLDYDLFYIANYSFFNDIKIIIKTGFLFLSKEKRVMYKNKKRVFVRKEVKNE